MKLIGNEIILSSNSPARLSLLKDAGFTVNVQPTHTKEFINFSDPNDTAIDIARQKMQSFIDMYGRPSIPVLTVDTLIYFEGQFIGKQPDRNSAKAILSAFSDNTHSVYSGAVICLPGQDDLITVSDSADITFFSLDELEIDTYLDAQEWIGAAGAYRIQKTGVSLVKSLDGDFYSVVGLPLMKIFGILRGQSY